MLLTILGHEVGYQDYVVFDVVLIVGIVLVDGIVMCHLYSTAVESFITIARKATNIKPF